MSRFGLVPLQQKQHRWAPDWRELGVSYFRLVLCTSILAFLYDQHSETGALPHSIIHFSSCSSPEFTVQFDFEILTLPQCQTRDPLIGDGWELIYDYSQAISLQPCLQAVWPVSQVPDTPLSRATLTGPRLTLTGTPGSAVGNQINASCFMADSPYQRPNTTAYQPDSLSTRAQPDMPSSSRDHAWKVPALCPRTAKALPRPPVNKGQHPTVRHQTVRSSKSMPLTRLKFASDNAFLVEMFTNLLHHFGNSSDVHTSLRTSPLADEYRKLLLNNYAATTLFRYLQAVQKFTRVTEQLGLDIHSLSESQLADILTVMRLPKSYETDRDTCSGNFAIKALGWWQQIAGISHLSIGFSPLVDSFLKTKLSKDRQEAPPLPLWKIFHWERRIPQGVEIPYEVRMLGSFLPITWSDLRFADAQRLRVESLVLNFQEFFGLVWRSKRSFGAKAAGLCRQRTFTRLFKFWQSDGTFQVLGNVADTMEFFREMLLTPWKKFQTQHKLANVQQMYTMHSMQATLLSYGPQLGALVSDSDRLLQGHHQDSKHSLHLYGRDCVWGAPRYQPTVITETQKGWRPKTAQHQGGKFPLTEPLEEECRRISQLPWQDSRRMHQNILFNGSLFYGLMIHMNIYLTLRWSNWTSTPSPLRLAVGVIV